MSVSEREMSQAIQNNQIIISPIKPENLNSSSYDVTLGFYFYRMSPPPTPLNTTSKEELQKLFYNPYSYGHIADKWGEFNKAGPIKEFEKFGMTFSQGDNVNQEQDVGIILRPHESIISHTHEFIGCLAPYCCILTSHPNLSLNFINVSAGSKWGNANYVDRWALHITNLSDYYVPLICGKKIATVSFFRMGDDALLQAVDFNIDEVKKLWRPTQLRPSTYMLKREPTRNQVPKKFIGGIEVPSNIPAVQTTPQQQEKTFRQQNIQYQQQINQQQRQHQQRMQAQSGKGGKRTLKLPEPARDKEGKPVLPPALQSITTKQTGNYIPPDILEYRPFNV